MDYSPENAYIKVAAMHIYAELNASSRSYELYNELHIKHIQNESCSYIIAPLLRAGGMFSEVVANCLEIQNFQRLTKKETADGIRKAMEFGAMTKADEFIIFQRERIEVSLTALEAKSLILDCAPLVGDKGVVGQNQGVVGGSGDREWIEQMVLEAHNPTGPFYLLHDCSEDATYFSDNRDLSILDYDVLRKQKIPSTSSILDHCHFRRHHHSLLLRSVLCTLVASPPKKGKTVKATNVADKRCKSVVAAIRNAEDFLEKKTPSVYSSSLRVMVFLGHFCVCVVGGFDQTGSASLVDLDQREPFVCKSLDAASIAIDAIHSTLQSKTPDLVEASNILHECVAPLSSCFVLCSDLAELFGWGRRKQKTKQCAKAVAKVALSLQNVARLLHNICESQRYEYSDRNTMNDSNNPYSARLLKIDADEIRLKLEGVVTQNAVEKTIQMITLAQEDGTTTLESFYQRIVTKQEEFNCDD